MNRRVLAPSAFLLALLFSTAPVFAQATKAAPTATPAPAAPAKWVKPYKGTATIDVIQSPSRKVGNEMVTVLKIKNTSPGAIALLRGDETWFDKNLKPASGDSPKPIRQPLNPGDVVEMTFHAPYKPDLYRSSYQFTHANGDVKATQVKQFK
jgi:hypothetical protein